METQKTKKNGLLMFCSASNFNKDNNNLNYSSRFKIKIPSTQHICNFFKPTNNLRVFFNKNLQLKKDLNTPYPYWEQIFTFVDRAMA